MRFLKILTEILITEVNFSKTEFVKEINTTEIKEINALLK